MLIRWMYLSLSIALSMVMLTACGAGQTEQPPAPAATLEPTATPIPPTPAPPTPTPEPPTATLQPTQEAPQATEPPATAAEPTATPIPPTPTPEPPTPTPKPQARSFSIVPAQSSAAYSVEEEFFGVGFNTAVGTTRDISGELSVQVDESQTPISVEGKITVDLSTLTSDQPDRDQNIRENWLESNKYPFAVFEFTRLEGFPASWAEGQEVTFRLVGNMTVREVTKELTFDVTATFDGQVLKGTATTYLLMADFGFDPPSIVGILKVSDGVNVTVQFTAMQVSG